ncbi:hypothetical protein HMPREF3036_01421 [Sutterella sp. KLE1602]|nr:hypothetical protein HMPREF3036_01421 [Sutterella sp. KLE1602]
MQSAGRLQETHSRAHFQDGWTSTPAAAPFSHEGVRRTKNE